jgi:Tfp pilus assembly protein PilF
MVRAALLLLPFLGVTSCAQLENVVQATRAQVTLVDGLRKFDAGEHPASAKALQRAIALGLGAKDRAEAHKHLAFIHCTAGREARCRDEFGKAIEADPGMRLDAAEAGHPVWGPIFRSMSGPGALSAGLKQYEDGDYAESAKNLQGAIELGIADKERVTAHKHLAFIHCASNRVGQCREEFRKALAVDPALDLAPEEAGHPVWGPIFRSLKAAK